MSETLKNIIYELQFATPETLGRHIANLRDQDKMLLEEGLKYNYKNRIVIRGITRTIIHLLHEAE